MFLDSEKYTIIRMITTYSYMTFCKDIVAIEYDYVKFIVIIVVTNKEIALSSGI